MFTMKRKTLKSLSIAVLSLGLCAYLPDPVYIDPNDFDSDYINVDTPLSPISIKDGDSFLYNTTITNRLIFEFDPNQSAPEISTVSYTFDNFTLQTYPQDDWAMEFRNLSSDKTLNIKFIVNGSNTITSGNSALSPIYLTSEGGDMNVIFTLPNCSCDQYSDITIGTASQSSQDIQVIERNNCVGTDTLLNCRCNPGDNERFMSDIKPNPNVFFNIYGYVHDYTEANLEESECEEPTCTESGKNVYMCPRCSSYVTETVPALGHDTYLNMEDTIEATCTEGGVNWYTCSRCDYYYTEDTDPLGHEWILDSEISPATCGGAGTGSYICELCGATKTDTISNEGIDHTWGDWVTVTEPDCSIEKDGLKRHTCTVCGATEEETIYFEHSWVERTLVEGTCLTEGKFAFVCSVCGYYDEEEVENTGYVPDNHEGTQIMIIDVEPTETTTGSAHYEWSCCGERVLNQQGQPLTVTLCKTNEHIWDLTRVLEEATCSHPGRGFYTCMECGMTKEQEIVVEHTWTDWETVREPDCGTKTNGLEKRTCLVCGEVETNEIEYEHMWHETTITEATCITEGSWGMVCAICGYYDPREVETTGYNPDNHEGTEVLVIDREPTATREGLGHYEWSCCHENILNQDETLLTVTLCKTNEHEWWIEEIIEQGTCTEAGVALYKCGVCGMTKRDAVSGHLWNETRFTEPTCITKGSWGMQCEICGAIDPEQVFYEDYDPDNHEGVKKLVVDVAPTTNSEGRGHYEWSCCGAKVLNDNGAIATVSIPKLTEDTSKNVLSDIIIGTDQSGSKPSGSTQASEALESANNNTLLEIANAASKAFEAVANEQNITEEKKAEYVESVQAATESAVIAGSKLDNSKEEATSITINLPERALPNFEQILRTFYSIQYETILGKSRRQNAPGGVTITGNIDYELEAAKYRAAVDCINTTVDHMAGAAGMIRECSNEKISTLVNDYVEQIGVRSFRDFDKEKADLEFAAKAYEAILINMQTQTIANLNESYEQLAKSAEGTALDELKEEYESQLAACKDIGQFEWLVIEIMRQKYNSFFSDQYLKDAITYDEYRAKVIPDGEANLTAFKKIYTDIFYKWALGDDAISYGYTEDYGITLQELTDATISSVVLREKKVEISNTPTTAEVTVAVVFGTLSLLTAGALITLEVLKKKKGVVSA